MLVRAWLRRQLLLALFTAVLGLMLINGAVRVLGGGEPSLLSPFSLQQKCGALLLLAKHQVDCLLHGHPEPRALIVKAAARHRVPPELLLSMARAESNLRPHRISHAGAMGLMQLMPETARWLDVVDPFDSAANIDASARYLRLLSARYRGDQRRMAAAYNAGPGRVSRSGALSDLPGETRHYVKRVMRGL